MTTFIALEGPDRVGKKTQSEMLQVALQKIGKKALVVEVPWDDGLTYKLIYHMLEHDQASKYPTLFQIFQNVNKILCQYIKMSTFEKYDFIIFDRWRLSSFVYGSLTDANMKVVKFLFDRLLCPDRTIVLLGKRLTEKAEDEYERNDSLQARVRQMYAFAYEHERGVIRINVDSTTRENVHEKIIAALYRSGLLTSHVV